MYAINDNLHIPAHHRACVLIVVNYSWHIRGKLIDANLPCDDKLLSFLPHILLLYPHLRHPKHPTSFNQHITIFCTILSIPITFHGIFFIQLNLIICPNNIKSHNTVLGRHSFTMPKRIQMHQSLRRRILPVLTNAPRSVAHYANGSTQSLPSLSVQPINVNQSSIPAPAPAHTPPLPDSDGNQEDVNMALNTPTGSDPSSAPTTNGADERPYGPGHSGLVRDEHPLAVVVAQKIAHVRTLVSHMPHTTPEECKARKDECTRQLLRPVLEEMKALLGEPDFSRWRASVLRYMRGQMTRDELAELIDHALDRVEGTRLHNVYCWCFPECVRGF
jgi:hypothetical protein